MMAMMTMMMIMMKQINLSIEINKMCIKLLLQLFVSMLLTIAYCSFSVVLLSDIVFVALTMSNKIMFNIELYLIFGAIRCITLLNKIVNSTFCW